MSRPGCHGPDVTPALPDVSVGLWSAPAARRRRPAPASVAAMPMRRLDPQRLLAAVNEQRAGLGGTAWTGPLSAAALGDGCVAAVAEALDAGKPPCREALRAAAMRLLDLLGARAPGRAVEVRIPPFAAIQCVAGPRHTRGTPPNVVETDAITWALLAAGRTDWPG